MKKHVVKLSAEERAELESVLRRRLVAGWKVQRSHALLALDQGEGGPAWTDERVAEAYRCTPRSVERWRKAAVEDGPLSLVERKSQERPARRRLGGEEEARLVALACSKAPEGSARWTLRLLARTMVELEVVEALSRETVRRALEKTRPSLGEG